MADDGRGYNAPRNHSHEETFQRAQETQAELKFPISSTGIVSLPPGSRGPKSLYLKRVGGSFGFTLRHFIIYPPDGLTEENDTRLAAVGALHAPMETIFVRKVKTPGPAQQAGLQKGDRIVAVNGVQVIDKPYSVVIQLIQKSPAYLHLLVVPKEDDALQRLFTETAYNPVSNQSYITDSPPTERRAFIPNNFIQQHRPGGLQVDAQFWNSLRYPFGQQSSEKRPQSHGSSAEHLFARKPQHHQLPNEIYAEIQIHDAPARAHANKAQPQVPIYKKMVRRASDANAYRNREQPYYDYPEFSSLISEEEMVFHNRKMIARGRDRVDDTSPAQSSANVSLLTFPNSAVGSRDDRRESSSSLTSSYADGSKDSLSSFDSNSTLTGQETDDSAILSRYRKSFQQKEEFLKMPANPYEPPMIQREFYGRPTRKLEKSQWPPNEPLAQRTLKPTHQNFQRVKNDIETERDLNQINQSAKEATSIVVEDNQHENNTNNIEDDDDKRVCSPTQVVITKARQFETGRAIPEDDPLLSDRTSFYKSELSKLSAKRLVPNVSERAQEYETRSEPRRETATNATISNQRKIQRDSRSLDSSDGSDNYTQRLHFRTNSTDSWNDGGASTDDQKQSGKLQRQDTLTEKTVQDEVGEQVVSIVRRRPKNSNIDDEDRITRRESYLKATEGSRLQFECDLSDGDGDTSPQILRSGSISGNSSSSTSLEREKGRSGSPFDKESFNVVREGTLQCKITELDGKRPTARSWRQTWAVLRGPKLFLYKDRNHQSPIGTSDMLEQSLSNGVDIRTSLVRVADDYTKRKHVLRVSSVNPCRSELLLQAENGDELADWVKVLHEQGATATDVETKLNLSANKQQAVPQSIPAITTIQVQGSRSSTQQPLASVVAAKSKTTATAITGRNRSPTGQSPVNKTRKPAQHATNEQITSANATTTSTGPQVSSTSPKSKTWRGRVAKQFRKIHGASSPSSPTAPDGSTFGVPLEQCIPSTRNQYVPRFVEVCTDIVDERGLQTIGIYRVPGNNASITALSEEVNRNYGDVPTEDAKWNDVHVVGSLLKSFFRRLPDSLVTNTLYHNFIRADKIDDPKRRMHELKRLIKCLPPHNYYTLRHLVFHLNRVMDNSEVNKMDAKNVAIVFGPNIVRPEEETMADMVSNNSHQCKILVTLLNYASWFFSETDEDIDLDVTALRDCYEESENNNQQTLLDSISKLEAMPAQKEKNTALFSSIISAAQRKVKRKTKGPTSLLDNKEELSSPTGSLPPYSPRFSPNDHKDNAIENKSNVIPTTVREMEGDAKTTAERMPWFNYATDQAEFQKRIEKFKNETEAMLMRPRYLEITVDKASRNSASIATGSTLSRHPNDQYPIMKTQSVSSVFAPRTTTMFDNRNSLNTFDNNNTRVFQYGGQHYDDRTGDGDVHFNSLITEGTNKSPQRNGSTRDKQTGRRNSSIENLNAGLAALNQNASLKKIKYENEGDIPKTASLDSINKCGTDDDTDLVSAMTKLYDKKLEDYAQPSILLGEGLPYADESPEKVRDNSFSDKENRPGDLYKNPSLHKHQYNNLNTKFEKEKSKIDEKDEDSSFSKDVPDNERHLSTHKLTLISNNIINGTSSKLRRSESLNKPERNVSPMNNKVKRSESLNKTVDKLKRSDSLTKNEKTESNISKKRELLTKRSKELKRKNGMPDRSIKRRHTVGGTKDPDKVTWLDKYQEEVNSKEDKEKNLRTSSPDLSSTRRERLLFEINLIGPENMVVALRQHLIGSRPQSFPESRIFKVPLESHV